MKKIIKIASALTMIFGLGAAHFVQDAHAEPQCKYAGVTCATAPDGTIYVKGQGY